MKVSICLDTQRVFHKPKDRREYGKITNRIARNEFTGSIAEIANKVGKSMYGMTPAVFNSNSRRNNENVKSIQLFGIDIDNEPEKHGGSVMYYEDIILRCKEHSLSISFIYETLRSYEVNGNPRFRVFFCHYTPINNLDIAKLILRLFQVIFPESDRSCVDPCRLFLGSRNLIDFNEDAVFYLDRFIYDVQKEIYIKDQAHYGKRVRDLARGLDIGVTKDNTLAIYGKHALGACCSGRDEIQFDNKTGEEMQSTIKYTIVDDKNSPEIVIYGVENTNLYQKTNASEKKDNEPPENNHITVDLERVTEVCELCKDFFGGNEPEHNLKFMIATNLRFVKGMRKRFMEVITRYSKNIEDWKYCWKYIKSMNYKPMSCENCPYADCCDHEANLILKLRSIYRRIEVIDKEPHYDELTTVAAAIGDSLERAIRYKGNDIILINAQTGAGKTVAVKDYILSHPGKYLVAFPLVSLKNEFIKGNEDRIAAMVSNKDLYRFMEKEEVNRLTALYDEGQYEDAQEQIAEMYEGIPEYQTAKRQAFSDYLNRDHILAEHDIIAVTHTQLMNLSGEEKRSFNIIADEDILYTNIKNMKQISISDISIAIAQGLFSKEKTEEIKAIIEGKDKRYYCAKSASFRHYISADNKKHMGINGNINDFLGAQAYYKDEDIIYFFTPQNITGGNKLIIISATADPEIYKRYFEKKGQEVITYDVPKAKYQGTLKQFSYYSMSRECIKNKIEKYGKDALIDHIKEMTPDIQYSISFLKYESIFKNQLHFGNALGTNEYSGKNAAIIGTPYSLDYAYKLIGSYLDINVNNCTMKRQRVIYNGYRFPFMTFEDDFLQRLHLYMINSELEQCIGRSRLLRTDAKVYLFSSFPCSQAELDQKNYLA